MQKERVWKKLKVGQLLKIAHATESFMCARMHLMEWLTPLIRTISTLDVRWKSGISFTVVPVKLYTASYLLV